MTAQVLRHPAQLQRAFASAGLHPALSAWIAAALPPDVDIRNALRRLRARSRDAAQNDDHMAYFLRLVESNVIGRQGIVCQARPRLLSGGYDKASAARIEDAFSEQCARGTWDASGQLSKDAFDRLALRSVAMDGECLIRIHELDPDSPTGFSVELIDAEALDLDYNADLSNGNSIRMGVEMTRRRRPVAYHLLAEASNPYLGYQSGAQRERVLAANVIHVYLPEWAWGSRGIPWAHASLKRMKMLSGYEEAAITAARSAAVKSAAYVTTPDYVPGTQPGGVEQADGAFAQDLEPGGIEVVPYGWDLKPLDFSWPNTDHGQFVKECLRGIASGLGVSYNALANDLEGVNYSSLRQGALTERDLWMLLQAWWIEWVSRPLYRRWLEWAIRSGRITRANGQPLPSDRLPALSQATFQGRRWPWVDPVKDMAANKAAIELCTKSVSEIIRESGRDPEEVWQELADDRAALEKLGLTLEVGKPAAAASQAVPPASPAPDAKPLSADDKAPATAPAVSPAPSQASMTQRGRRG